MQVCHNILSIWTPPFFNEIRAFKKKKKKKKASHPPLPSQSHKGRDGNNEASSFQRLSLPISGVEEEAPGHEVT